MKEVWDETCGWFPAPTGRGSPEHSKHPQNMALQQSGQHQRKRSPSSEHQKSSSQNLDTSGSKISCFFNTTSENQDSMIYKLSEMFTIKKHLTRRQSQYISAVLKKLFHITCNETEPSKCFLLNLCLLKKYL